MAHPPTFDTWLDRLWLDRLCVDTPARPPVVRLPPCDKNGPTRLLLTLGPAVYWPDRLSVKSWPDRLWPDRLWPDRLWPNRLWPDRLRVTKNGPARLLLTPGPTAYGSTA